MQIQFYTLKVFDMATKSSTSTKRKIPAKKTVKKSTSKKFLTGKIIKTKEDKMLEKVEKYVDKNREKTSQEMMERKSKRPTTKYNAADLEVMISRVSAESKPKQKAQETSKWVLYIIYAIIIIAILIFVIKYFFVGKMPQIS